MGERYRSDREEKLLEDLITRYQTLGIVVWGEIEGASGTYAKILVKSDGTVKVEGVTTISGSVDISDKWTRQLGQVDLQRYLGSAFSVLNPLHSQIVASGVVVDPRSVRALVKTTDELYSVLRTDAGVAYDARQMRSLISTDIITAYGSQAQALLQRATTYDLIVQLRSAGVEIDPRDILDRAARLLGIVYGSQSQQLLQRATTYDLEVQLRTAGAEYDARQVRALTSTDVVSTVFSASDMKTVRWGIPREPTWTDGAEATAPAAGTALVTVTVSTGKTGRVFGVHISADEANQFQLLVGSTVVKRFALGAAGVIHIVLSLPLKDSIAAASVITVKNVTAGASGKTYQASLLYDEA